MSDEDDDYYDDDYYDDEDEDDDDNDDDYDDEDVVMYCMSCKMTPSNVTCSHL